MSAKFKCGDLAIISLFADRAHGPARLAKDGWRCLDDNHLHRAGDVLDARPLVVIDPEDREQVERLALLIRDNPSPEWAESTAAALRSFANPTPPKPEEPTGRYAVVEDRGGLEWVRADPGNGYVWKCLTLDRWNVYADIDVVAVLSPGVQ